MSPLISTDPAHRPILDFVAGELASVERVFSEQLESGLPAVNRLCEHVERYRGKMLRPILVLVSGLAANQGGPKDGSFHLSAGHHVLAAVCEMIHMATLVHDDVLDDAEVRRRGVTVNALRGNEAAVLLGDYLISNSFHLCSTLDRPAINRRIGEVTNTLCAGELLQLHHRDQWSIDEATYFEIIERKTASLIGVCCELGAALSTTDDAVIRGLAEYGRRIGVAFQIQDDLLDVVGDEQVVGKSLGRDLDKGKLTLPMILYFSASRPGARERMLRWLADPGDHNRSDAVNELLADSGAIARARSVAEREVNSAKAALESVVDSAARRLLLDMADEVVRRRF
ncbi:MAG: polyprenyl synthetase family protein [Phycisphaerales bacterium]